MEKNAERVFRQQKETFVDAFGVKRKFSTKEIEDAMSQCLTQKESLSVAKWPTDLLTLFQSFAPSPELCTQEWWNVKVAPASKYPYDEVLAPLSITAIRKRVNQLIDGLQVYVTDIEKREKNLGFYAMKTGTLTRSKHTPDIAIVQVAPEEAAYAQLSAACVKLVSKRGVADGQEVIRTAVIEKGNVPQNFVLDRKLQSIMPALVLETRPLQTTMDVYPRLLKTVQQTATGCGEVYFLYKYRKADPPCSNVTPVTFETLLTTIADVPFQKTNNPGVFDQGLWDEGMRIPPPQVIATVLNQCATAKAVGSPKIRGAIPGGVAARVVDRQFYSVTPMLYDPGSGTTVELIADASPLETFDGIYWNPSEPDLRRLILAAGLVFPIDQPGKCAAMAHSWMREGFEYRVVVSYGSMPCLWILKTSDSASGFPSSHFKSSDFYMMACSGLWVPFHNLSNAVLGEPQIVAAMWTPSITVLDVGDLDWYCYQPRTIKRGAERYIDVPIADLKPQFTFAPSARTARRSPASLAAVPPADVPFRAPCLGSVPEHMDLEEGETPRQRSKLLSAPTHNPHVFSPFGEPKGS